jgi:hypothetical protein
MVDFWISSICAVSHLGDNRKRMNWVDLAAVLSSSTVHTLVLAKPVPGGGSRRRLGRIIPETSGHHWDPSRLNAVVPPFSPSPSLSPSYHDQHTSSSLNKKQLII